MGKCPSILMSQQCWHLMEINRHQIVIGLNNSKAIYPIPHADWIVGEITHD